MGTTNNGKAYRSPTGEARLPIPIQITMFSACFGGIRPGLLAVALSILAFVYYFVTLFYSLAMEIKR